MCRFGPLDKVQVVLDGHSGRSRGFAFIYFVNQVSTGIHLELCQLRTTRFCLCGIITNCVGDMFLGLPDPDPLVRGMDLDPSHKGVERTEIMLANYNLYTKCLRLKIMCLRVSYKKKI